MVENTTNIALFIIDLYRINYLNKYHVREMARLIGKSHVTLLPHLKALEKEHIIKSITIGKNKTYGLNLDSVAVKYYLSLAETRATIRCIQQAFFLKKIVEELITYDGSFVLFGSYAKGTYQQDSDIDILHIGTTKNFRQIEKFGQTYDKAIRIKSATRKKFQHALRKKDPLVREIVKNHILLQNQEVFINALWDYYHEIK
ncbi:MAG: nucleotidyltransferase domain-containing protein [Nanoarchaeota archaeon]